MAVGTLQEQAGAAPALGVALQVHVPVKDRYAQVPSPRLRLAGMLEQRLEQQQGSTESLVWVGVGERGLDQAAGSMAAGSCWLFLRLRDR